MKKNVNGGHFVCYDTLENVPSLERLEGIFTLIYSIKLTSTLLSGQESVASSKKESPSWLISYKNVYNLNI